MSVGVFVGIGSAVLLLSGLLIFGATREPLLRFFSWIIEMTGHFISVMPKALKILMFLFFIVFVIGTVVNGFLGLMFFCDGDTIYKPNSFFTGVGIAMASTIEGNATLGNITTAQYESILNDNSVLYNSPDKSTPEGAVYVKCQANNPRLTFFGINVFDYRTWIFLFILGGMFTFYAYIKKN